MNSAEVGKQQLRYCACEVSLLSLSNQRKTNQAEAPASTTISWLWKEINNIQCLIDAERVMLIR